MALNVKVIYETLVNLLILNNFSLYYMVIRAIFTEKHQMFGRNPNPCSRILRAFNLYRNKHLDPFYSAHFELETYDKYRRIYSQKKVKTATMGDVTPPR